MRAKLPETRIAYMTINATPSRWANVEREKKANQLIKDYVASGKNLDYIDTFDATLGADGKPREELFVKDRLHFNDGRLQDLDIYRAPSSKVSMDAATRPLPASLASEAGSYITGTVLVVDGGAMARVF